MVWVPEGEKILKVYLFVLTECTNVTDRRTDTAWRLSIASRSKNGNKTAKINVKNFLQSLTTVVRAQNDTPKTANITDTIFDRTYWYSPYKRRRFDNRSVQSFCILLIKDVLSVIENANLRQRQSLRQK